MVTDVQYGMTSSGRHIVHGNHVGADQAYNRNAMLYDRNKQTSSEETTNLAGKRYMVQISAALGMQTTLLEAGMQVFRLASANNFIQGRRTKSVAAVSLYIACRTQRDNPNQHMLIDFADVLELNVFHLGHIYKGLIALLRINPNGHLIQPINPEDLILRFSQRLEFGDETMRVANDAVRLVQRMNRDWMTPGRRPAGICGAALVLAARMNNFRRTVREIVFVVKVQEQTIFKRLDEFKLTESSGLTVEEFRTIDLERATDPPAFYQQQDGSKKRKRRAKHLEFDDDGDDAETTQTASRPQSVAPSAEGTNASAAPENGEHQLPTPAVTQQALADSRSMPPPPLPVDPDLVQGSGEDPSEPSESTQQAPPIAPKATQKNSARLAKAMPKAPAEKKRRGRPKKNVQTDTEATPASESQLTSALLDPLNIDPASALQALPASNPSQSTDPATSIDSSRLNKDKNDDTTNVPAASTAQRAPIPSDPDISDSEFASDPEVNNCLLNPREVEIKTRIWTHENHDYLRAQSAKLLKKQLAEANGTAKVVKRRIRRRGRLGDLSNYGVGQEGGIAEGSPVAGTPEEAVMRMLGVRAYSKKLNYEVLREAYTPSSSSASATRRPSLAGIGEAGSPGSGVGLNNEQASRASSSSSSSSAPPSSPITGNAVVGTGPSTRTRRREEMHSADDDHNDTSNEISDKGARAGTSRPSLDPNTAINNEEAIDDEDDEDEDDDDDDDDENDEDEHEFGEADLSE